MASESEAASKLTLENITLDIQTTICIFLHPSDILALRKTCKALQDLTRRRVIWIAALHRVCLDNTLFLPSFPIPDMSDVELEKAAMAPRRWINLCAAFEKQPLDEFGLALNPRTTRVIKNSLVDATHPAKLFIVPGGRYLVSSSPSGVFIWDLGYTSSSDCKLIASVKPEGGPYSCLVQATPDGMGLIIFLFHSYRNCSIYEIYPQNETPLTKIAPLNFSEESHHVHLLPDRVVWCNFRHDRIVFRVWNYRVNHSVSFSAPKEFEPNFRVIGTKTAIIVLCKEEILIWAIPLLSPQPPDFSDHNPTHIPPLFSIKFAGGIIHQNGYSSIASPWYFGSSQPLYFDIISPDLKLHGLEIVLEPDLSDASLHVVNTSNLSPSGCFDIFLKTYCISEDTVFSGWSQFGRYVHLTSSRFASAISHSHPVSAKILLPSFGLSLCPASGRYVHLDGSNIVVGDFF